jgi:hypothetical protein
MKFFNIMLALVILFCCAAVEHRETFGQNIVSHSDGKILLQYVKGIEGKKPESRRQFIKDQLKEFGVGFTTMPFDTILTHGEKKDTIYGENIIVRFGSEKRKIVIGAHYDAVPDAPGANDNGSGTAVLLGMVHNLCNKSLNHSIDFCFFDQEESGLIGSAVYVKRYDTSYTHIAMINLDVEGTGNEVYVGPVGGGDDELMMSYIHEARDATKFAYEENEIYPGSDHESFAEARLENISISIVPEGDVGKLVKWTKSGFKRIDKPDDVPEVLKVMHTPEDKSDYVTPEALAMSYEFTLTTLLLLDAGEQ